MKSMVARVLPAVLAVLAALLVLVMAPAAAISIFSPTSAYADVVSVADYSDVPKEQLLTLERREFVVNGYEGLIVPQLRPGESETVAKLKMEKPGYAIGGYNEGDPLYALENGTSVVLDAYTVVDDVYWGRTASWHGSTGTTTWMRLDQLLTTYTEQDFVAGNKDKIVEIADPDDYEVNIHAGTVLWEWPGSDRPKRILEEDHLETTYTVIREYTDVHGNKWGYVRGYSGFQASLDWVCLDDPTNTEIPAFTPEPTPQRWAPGATYDWTIGQGEYPDPVDPKKKIVAASNRSPHILVLAVAGVALVAFVILLVINRRIKKNKRTKGMEDR